jgi:hypothetical protein
LVDLVQSEHAKRVIMFSVQKSVDIVGGYRGVHIFPLADLELFSIRALRVRFSFR